MKKERKERKIDWQTIVEIVIASLMVLAIGLSIVYFNMRMETGYTEIVNCEVVDKYYERHFRGHRSYFLTLQGQTKHGSFEDDIHISEQTFYDNVIVGDVLPCEVVYDENGIIQLNVTNPGIVQHTEAEARQSALVFIVSILGASVLIVGITRFCSRRKKLKKLSE